MLLENALHISAVSRIEKKDFLSLQCNSSNLSILVIAKSSYFQSQDTIVPCTNIQHKCLCFSFFR